MSRITLEWNSIQGAIPAMPPILPWPHLVRQSGHKISKIGSTRCQILRPKCTKFDFRWVSAPDPAGGAYSAPQDPVAVFKGPTCKGTEEEGRREGKGRERKGGGRGREGRGWFSQLGSLDPPVCLIIRSLYMCVHVYMCVAAAVCKCTVHERCVARAPSSCITTYVKSRKASMVSGAEFGAGKTVVTCKIKHLQNICKNVLTFYFTCRPNHLSNVLQLFCKGFTLKFLQKCYKTFAKHFCKCFSVLDTC